MNLALAFLGICLLGGLLALFSEDGILVHLLDDLKNRNDRGKLRKPSSKHVV